LRPRSDLDLLVVCRRSAADAERRALVAGLLRVSGRGARRPGDRPVELAIVVAGDLRPWRYPPVLDFLYGEWLRNEYAAGLVPDRRPSPDLVTMLTMARAADRPLRGPSLATLLDPVPAADLRRAILEGVPSLLEDLEPDTTNVVLTLARVWVTAATGEIRSKDGAADWALDRLPGEHRPVLVRARAVYLGDAEDRWVDLADRVGPHADHVVARIEEAAASG
jgi:streptomycin 3"-adenylyltransferase